MKTKIIVYIISILLILSSCSFSSTDVTSYTPTPTLVSTATPYITFSPTPEPTPETVEIICGYVTLTDNSSCLNLRSQPNSSSAIIESLPNGTQLEILEEQEQWYKVKVNEQVGYVYCDYVSNIEKLTVSAITPTFEPATNTPDDSHTVWINVDSLNIRTQPNTDSTVIGNIPYGDSVQGTYTGDWMYTTYNGVKGYIYLGKSASGRSCVVYNSDALVELPTVVPNTNTQSSGSVYVYITKTGSKYHTSSCGYLHSSKIRVTLEYAISHGYTPCSRCHPP